MTVDASASMTSAAENAAPVTLSDFLASTNRVGSRGLCSMERSLGLVGTRSALALIREAFYGARRFDDLVRQAGITESVAAKRLRELVGHGIFERVPYREEGQRTRHEYVLTQSGRALFPIVAALMEWGETYARDETGGIGLTHTGCGAAIEVQVRCAEGHAVSTSEISAG